MKHHNAIHRSAIDPPDAASAADEQPQQPAAPLAGPIGSTRYVVLLAVGAVLLVAIALFAIGTGMAVIGVINAVQATLHGDLATTNRTVEFLEIVSVMLKAVIFYLIGVGLYSLFIAPLNLPIALGVETLNDLEAKVVSAIVVIMSVTFLEHYILWESTGDLLPMGLTLAAVVLALVVFQVFTHWARRDQVNTPAGDQQAARARLFTRGESRQPVRRPHAARRAATRV
jgi:uncharacterized membrane protein YqhA